MLLTGERGSSFAKVIRGEAIPTNDDFTPVVERVSTLDRTPAAIPTIYEVGPVKYGLTPEEIAAARYSLHAEKRAEAAASRHELNPGSARHGELRRRYLLNEVNGLISAKTKQGDTFWHTDVGGYASDREADSLHRASRQRTIFQSRRNSR